MVVYHLIALAAEAVLVLHLRIEKCGEVKKLAPMVNISLLFHRLLLKYFGRLTNAIAEV